ncbi:ABC transporter ATP-binding protein [Afifella sp. IM 167]|uniref:ABC transporter ATP-binding protein n=1 Tax=Afifella sp. IM 167 TaxID=2033586 RepID=UPI001CCC848C|nr:ABC transporter ATP-binding protein [Afifella sp. IM 167]MBZ8134501.1 Fe3+/spermidine/putrescine ABC transporter ATP-binding protein [Afifella sp. IM 167]
MPFLELSGLTKRFGDVTAVDDFSLAVEKGEFVSLLGPSGCGKTTTLQMIAGFEQPSSGHITLNGRRLDEVPARQRGLGIVFQTYALFPHMTVEENVAFGLEMRGIGRQDRKRKVAAALDLVHLSNLSARYPRAMSGGQRQRVALARALVIEPELLLLDEPLSNLDAKLREEMQLELRRIQQEAGVTTLLVTHDQNEAMALSDRVAVMHHGRLMQEETPFHVYENPKSSFISTFLGKTNSLAATVVKTDEAGSVLACNGMELKGPAAHHLPGPVTLSLRPERIEIVEENEAVLSGTVIERIFLGDQWLFRIETPLGPLLVVRRNRGLREPEHGEAVHLAWTPEHLRVLPAEEGAA